MRAIRRLHQSACSNTDVLRTKQPKLSSEIQRLVAQSGVPPKTLAKQAGIDTTTIRRWLKGATPRHDTLPALRRLEARLGVERDTLVELIERPATAKSLRSTLPSHSVRHAQRPKHNLTLAESELGVAFLIEWHALFDYKTTSFPTLERQTRGVWRLIPKTMSTSVDNLAQRGTMACPSADNVIGRLRSFFGVLTNLPPELGGIAWEEPPPITLAWLAHPQALHCYLEWLTAQSEGIRHGGHRVFASTVASLLRPTTGFLWQQAPTFRPRLPVGYQPLSDDAWREMCAKSHKFLREYLQSANGVSRNPEERISDLLALPNPLLPIRQAISRIQEEAANAPPGSISEARHKRNALVLGLLLSNPLRLRTISALTWLPNGQGTLRGNSQQGWRIQLQPHHLKTGKRKRWRGYDVKIADWIKPMLDEYIAEYRETLLAGMSSPYLFVGDREGEIWEGISATVFALTRRHIPGCQGFGPHAMRHLVATAWLRTHPGDFLTVAELLHDNLATVLDNYAHLKKDDSFSRYEVYLNSLD